MKAECREGEKGGERRVRDTVRKGKIRVECRKKRRRDG